MAPRARGTILARDMAPADEIYVSTDVEADGPTPGLHSMLSFASVAFAADGRELGAFTANLIELPGATTNAVTMAWWQQHPDALAKARLDPEAPDQAMPRYARWLEELPGRPVFVGHPAAWDFQWIYWYLIRFCGRSPFGHSALDIKSFAMALLRLPYRDCVKANFPHEWFPAGSGHTHVALDDAREQGHLFCAMLRDLHQRPAPAGAPRTEGPQPP